MPSLRSAHLGALLAVCVASGCAANAASVDSSPATGASPTTGAASSAAADSGDVGFFTLAQVDAGLVVWEETCSSCHERSEVSGSDFMFEWEGSSVGRLFRTISRTMPDDAPGSLPTESYLAVVAYVLHLNEFPTGPRALTSDEASLNALRIER